MAVVQKFNDLVIKENISSQLKIFIYNTFFHFLQNLKICSGWINIGLVQLIASLDSRVIEAMRRNYLNGCRIGTRTTRGAEKRAELRDHCRGEEVEVEMMDRHSRLPSSLDLLGLGRQLLLLWSAR